MKKEDTATARLYMLISNANEMFVNKLHEIILQQSSLTSENKLVATSLPLARIKKIMRLDDEVKVVNC